MITYHDTPDTAPQITGSRSVGTFSTKSPVADDDRLFALVGRGYDGSGWLESAGIYMYCDGTVTTGFVPSRIVFMTSDTDATIREVASIDKDGLLNVVGKGYFTDDLETETRLIGGSIISGSAISAEGIISTTGNQMKIEGVSPFLSFIDTTAGQDNFAISVNTNEMRLQTTGATFGLVLTGASHADPFNIGINTSNPTHRLTVIGDALIGSAANYTTFDVNGLQTMAGTARVLRDVDFEPDAVKKGGVGPADSTEDGFPIHDYDSTNDESIKLHWETPHDYASAGTVHIHFDWFVDTAPTSPNTVTWGVEYKKQSIGDNFGFSGTTTTIVNQDITTGTPANDKKTHVTAEISLVTTGFEPGDFVLMRLFRDADASEPNATDDYGSDVRIFDYHLEYLSDKIGEEI